MHTKDILADALAEAGVPAGMVAQARAGYYHDYLSPLATPALQLATDLTAIGTPAALAVRRRVINGDFDATKEEADEWAASPDGQETFRSLMGGRRQ